MAIRFFGPSGGSARGFDADVLLWKVAVEANGGSVSLARLIIVDQFVFSEKASGTWALTDDYWGFWAENAIQALTSLKQLRLATAVNAPTFTADRGYVFDGTTNYLDTGFIPSTHAVAMTGTDMRAGAYERANLNTSTYALGTLDNANQNLRIIPRDTSDRMSANINSASVILASSITDSRGFIAASRTAAAVFEAWLNGVSTGTGTPGTTGTALPTRSIFIGANNNAGTPTTFRAASMGFVAVGSSLSAAQELAQYNAIQAWATAVEAQV